LHREDEVMHDLLERKVLLVRRQSDRAIEEIEDNLAMLDVLRERRDAQVARRNGNAYPSLVAQARVLTGTGLGGSRSTSPCCPSCWPARDGSTGLTQVAFCISE